MWLASRSCMRHRVLRAQFGSAATAVALDGSLVGLVDSGDGLVMPDMQTAAFMQILRIGFSARACPE